jgi:hypothetical protein
MEDKKTNFESIPENKQAGKPAPLENKRLTYLYFYGIKQAFVDAFRQAFGHDSMEPRYKYNDKSEFTQIHIYRNFPKRVDKFPALIVESNGGNASMNFLGEEFLFQGTGDAMFGNKEDSETYYYYGGILLLNVDVHIYAKEIQDLEKLMDYTALFMRYVFKEKFFQENLAFNKINFTPEEETDVEGTTMYKATLSTKITSSFENRIDSDLVQKVQSMSFQVVAINND